MEGGQKRNGIPWVSGAPEEHSQPVSHHPEREAEGGSLNQVPGPQNEMRKSTETRNTLIQRLGLQWHLKEPGRGSGKMVAQPRKRDTI